MKEPILHILFQFKDGPWGGGNQFLKALKTYFNKLQLYTEDANEAQIILFNSNPRSMCEQLKDLFRIKIKRQEIIVVNRMDGPVSLIRNGGLNVDKAMFELNRRVCDGTIFQSCWSEKNCKSLGLRENHFEVSIFNAPDPLIFNRDGKAQFSTQRKVKLIATSWSDNWNKGFDVYKWLDESLDFNKFEMTFIGNSPIEFRNIRLIPPLTSGELAEEIKRHDIYITASKKDPCSNSLIEALHCGLPAIARRDGGHPEIVGKAGLCFENIEEIPALLGRIVDKYDTFQGAINMPSMETTGERYLQFISNLYASRLRGDYQSKKFTAWDYLCIRLILERGNFAGTIYSKIKRLITQR